MVGILFDEFAVAQQVEVTIANAHPVEFIVFDIGADHGGTPCHAAPGFLSPRHGLNRWNDSGYRLRQSATSLVGNRDWKVLLNVATTMLLATLPAA